MPKKFSPEYRELMQSWQWKFIRAMVFNRDRYTCCDCGIQLRKPTKTLWLECDHLRYPPKGSPLSAFLEQPLSDFATRCCKCHRKVTKARAKNKKSRKQKSCPH